MTLMQIIERLRARLDQAGVCFGHGTTNARDEAVWLALWQLGLPLDDLDSNSERVLSDAEVQAIEALVERRIATRQPAAYLTGEAWLQGVPFHADARAIVPRSLIAEVIADGTLDLWLPEDGPARVLDLCTGGGSLAVLAALAWPDCSVTATDLSPDALALAHRNVARHGLADRIELQPGDGLAAADGRYDLVLCNPPYVNAASMAELPAEFRAEPNLALAGGSDGMDFIRPLLHAVARYLTDNGVLVLEIGHEREYFDAAFPRIDVMGLSTSAGDDQVLLLTRDALLALEEAP